MSGKFLSDQSELSCAAIINDGLTGISFELGEKVRAHLLGAYNIKVQRVESGFICYHGHDVGRAQTARSEGEAFALFLKLKGCCLKPGEISGSILSFCEEKFRTS